MAFHKDPDDVMAFDGGYSVLMYLCNFVIHNHESLNSLCFPKMFTEHARDTHTLIGRWR